MTKSTDGRCKKVINLIINNFTFELKRKVLHIRPKLEFAPHTIDMIINSVSLALHGGDYPTNKFPNNLILEIKLSRL